jgi:Putative  PD-(D/E)XK family member, (DUF4420)
VNELRHLSWENFKNTVLVSGEQRVHRVSDNPIIEIFGEGDRNLIGIWLETSWNTVLTEEILKLAFVNTRLFSRDGHMLLELLVSHSSLSRPFYHLATAISERVLFEKISAIAALSIEIQTFAELLQQKALLSIERQLGLLGELVLLERLVSKNGQSFSNAWIGPRREPHDFRIGLREFEVKTTLRAQRIHTINGVEQLTPSQKCQLFLVSILFGSGGKGGGFSLTDKVDAILKLLDSDAPHREKFLAGLEASGFRTSDRDHYSRRFELRRPMAIVPVDAKFPAITRRLIQASLGSLAARVESIQYEVNVEGIEHEEKTGVFNSALPI